MKNHYRISSPVSRAIFSVFDTKVWEIFTQETRYGLLQKVWDSKPSTYLMLTRKDRKVSDCSALYVMTTTYFWPPIRFFASHALKEYLTRLSKHSSHFTLQINYLVSLLWRPTHRLLVYFGALGSKTAHFCTVFQSCRVGNHYFNSDAWKTTISIAVWNQMLWLISSKKYLLNYFIDFLLFWKCFAVEKCCEIVALVSYSIPTL